MTAALMALQWVEDDRLEEVRICSDSLAALTSIQAFSSQSWPDLFCEVHEILYRLYRRQSLIRFMWVPAHQEVEGKEIANNLAKLALKPDGI